MHTDLPLEWVLIFTLSTLAALLALYFQGLFLTRREKRVEPDTPRTRESYFLLEGDDIIGQDLQGLQADHPLRTAFFWVDLRDHLTRSFSAIPDDLQLLPENERTVLEADGATLDMLRKAKRTRIVLSEKPSADDTPEGDRAGETSSEEDGMRALAAAPYPIWKTSADGAILWRNNLCTTLFEDPGAQAQMMTPADRAYSGCDTRICISNPLDGASSWYDVHHVQTGDHMFHFARDVTEIIHAETVQRDFVQTLTKTFSNLTIGLAIFDHDRRLALFNPALVDLTQVQVAFLSARPDLMDFFDHLREAQIMPEPKSYADWRTQIRDAISQANHGLYRDLWSLADGLTYRVTGRPHPDGAIAFLFEDISAEISLTRRFRTEIELRQTVLDHLEEAVAVFGSNNLLIFCNRPCSDLIRMNPDESFADLSLQDFLAATRDALGESDALTVLGTQLFNREARASASLRLPMRDGRQAICHTHALPGGAKLLSIVVAHDAPAARRAVPAS